MIHVNKREEAPASLAEEKEKANGKYNKADVIDALKEDANNKCYLCEYLAPTSIHVEHFSEHRGDKDKKFDWNNLFYSCMHCNETKAATFPAAVGTSDLLNCTITNCKVDLWLIHRYTTGSDLKSSKVEITKNPASNVDPYTTQTDNTIKLLKRIFNGSGIEDKAPNLNAGAENLRYWVGEELQNFKESLDSYVDATTPEDKERGKREVYKYLGEGRPFLSFKHWYLRDLGMATEFGIEN